MFRVETVTPQNVGALEALFATDEVADRCWCMWFLRPVKEFHQAGREGNRVEFLRRAAESTLPMGLLAFEEDEPVGWCAAGPRHRYARMLKSPTLQGRDPGEDATAWLVPCFFVRSDRRAAGVASALLAAAVDLAAAHGAPAIEGFPLSGAKRRSGGSDFMTGVESLFAACGFEPVHRPSDNRVIMRRMLKDHLVPQYAVAWREWSNSDDARLWDAVSGDGLDD